MEKETKRINIKDMDKITSVAERRLYEARSIYGYPVKKTRWEIIKDFVIEFGIAIMAILVLTGFLLSSPVIFVLYLIFGDTEDNLSF